MRVFIAGSRRITRLNNDVISRLDNILQNRYEILVGDANGVDKLVQEYANDRKYETVTVYCVNSTCRNNIGNWHISSIAFSSNKKDFSYYASKDEAMARDADYGFMIWDGRSKGTLRSLERLVCLNKKLLLYHSQSKCFFNVHSKDSLSEALSQIRDNFPSRSIASSTKSISRNENPQNQLDY
jgi:hypothetical protein